MDIKAFCVAAEIVLANDPTAMGWARAKLAGDAGAKALDVERSRLTNTWFKKHIKAGGDVDDELTKRFALLAATLDRANALVCMQIVRDVSPRGFLWATEAVVNGLTGTEVVKEGRPYTMVGDTKTFQQSSITSAYEIMVRESTDAEFTGKLGDLIKPMAPQWMEDEFHLGFPPL